ncbi:MAG: hypothetical protein JNL28_02950 [Planctomycetes bacterium]|nr:hypothetical protein [Planctomycetota bacterium]
MIFRTLGTAALATLLASSAFAQTNFPEVEPNGQKSEADAVGIVTMTAGDTITGVSTGTSTTLGLTTDASSDTFRIKTTALPLGIYQHRMTLTTSTTTGHTGTIRGLNQTGVTGTASTGGTPGTTDSTVQTSSTTTVNPPPRTNQWYGFGKQEELYYRVSGVSTTTAAYTATLSTSTVGFTVIPTPFESGSPIEITTMGLATADTDIFVFDGNLDAIPGYNNDDNGPAGVGLQSRLVRSFPTGTYYLAIGRFNTAWNLPSAPDDDSFGLIMDFPGSLVCSTTTPTTTTDDRDFAINAANGSVSVSNQVVGPDSYSIQWFRFTTAAGAPNIAPSNDLCANALSVGTGTTTGSSSFASASGTSSCDATGADVWFSYTNASASLQLLSVDSCGTSYDSALAIFSACGGTELACNDDCGGTPCGATASCISGLSLSPSQTVLIRLSDKGLGGGAYTLNVSAVFPPPSNDDCATPIVLGGPGTYPFLSEGATTGVEGQSATTGCGSSVKRDTWYTYTATVTGTLTVSTCAQMTSSSKDTKIALYSGAGCPAGTGITCNDDAGSTCSGMGGSTLESIVSTSVNCGDVITIQMGHFSTTTVLAGTFTVSEVGTSCSTPTTAFCLGDGTGAPCPCGNTGAAGHGCGSSAFAGGAILSSTGIASDETSGTDTLVLTATDIPGPGLFFQSNGLAGAPINFGDGHLCASVGIIRLGVVFPAAGVASYPGGLTPNPIHIQGGAVAGQTKHYQCWYRSVPGLCTANNYDLTQGLTLTWVP